MKRNATIKYCWLITGRGPNRIVVPAGVASSWEKGIKALQKIFERAPDYTDPDSTVAIWYSEKSSKKGWNEALQKIFILYYGGCGECDSIVLEKVPKDTLRLYAFDLD